LKDEHGNSKHDTKSNHHIYRTSIAYMEKELKAYRVESVHFEFLPFSQKLYEPGFNLPSDCLNEMQ